MTSGEHHLHEGVGRLPDGAYASHPWRIHEIASDFELEDVWALPARGDRGDFRALVERFVAGDPARGPALARALWTIRWKIGELLGWDAAEEGIGERVRTLRDRLPADLLAAPGPTFQTLPFTSLYLLEDEFAAEIANRTVHGVMHLGFVADGTGRSRCQMAVLVKPNGLLGKLYMAAIRPFRYLIVYPAMMRQIERELSAGEPDATSV